MTKTAPLHNGLVEIGGATLANGQILSSGDLVKLNCFTRPEFSDGGTYWVVGLYQHLDETALQDPRTVQQAELLKVEGDKILNWSWKKQQWVAFVPLDEPPVYADISWLEKIEKTPALGGAL